MAERSETYDIIVCGGGGAGCPIAARLAECLPHLQILLIERGADNREAKRLDKPLDSLFWLFDENPYLQWHYSGPQQALGGRQSRIPVGNVLGGGTSVNTLMYNTPAASDFDDWNQPGWAFKDLEPLTRRTISKQAIKVDEEDRAELQFEISAGGHELSWNKAIHSAFEQVYDIPFKRDITDYKTAHSVGHWPKLIDANGIRTNTANAYVHRSKSPNLHVLADTTIGRVIIEKGQAVGVEVHSSKEKGKDLRAIRASREVILCCGALGTPGVLERSGVGSPDVLKRAGVDVKVDLPGVGKGLDDHQLTVYCYHAKDSMEGEFDEYARGNREVKRIADEEWERTGKGMVASNGYDCGFKIQPTEEDLQRMGSATSKYWRGLTKPDKAMYTGTFIPFFYAAQPRPSKGKYYSFGGFNNYPASRGSVHIRSADPFDMPVLDTGLLTDPVDLPQHVWMYKLQREVCRRMPWFHAEHAGSHPRFKPGSPAALRTQTDTSISHPIPRIQYTPEDDEAIEQYIKESIATAYHSISTCQMKAKDRGGVVDARLRVHGVKGLRIADLSIVPKNVGSNTTSVVLLIAERAVQIVVEDVMAAQRTAKL